MNIAKHLKVIHKYNTEKYLCSLPDQEEAGVLQIILEKFASYGFPDHVTFDIYHKDSFGEYQIKPWCQPGTGNHNLELSPSQRLTEYKKGVKKLEPLCKKLRKYGFKCKVVSTGPDQQFPYILVKV